MRIVNDNQRIQIRISKHSSRLGSKSNKGKCTCNQNNEFRGGKYIRKRCDRACTICGKTFRFLQYNVSSTQKVRVIKNCDRPETTQLVLKDRTFQNEYTEQDVKSSKK